MIGVPRSTAVPLDAATPDHRGRARARTPGGPALRALPSPAQAGGQPAPATMLHWARAFVQLYLEVEAGRRPRGHLEPLMTRQLYARLSGVWVRGGRVGRVLRVHGVATAAGRYDAVALVSRGRRCTAVGLRLVRARGGWRADQAVCPEHGPLPAAQPCLPEEEPDSFDLVLG